MSSPLPLDRYRNIGIMASLDAGKTTTTERILANAGGIETSAGAALDRWDDERAISLSSAATACLWRDFRVTLLDLPGLPQGSTDFDRVMRSLDSVVNLLDGTVGVDATAETLWRLADAYGVPRLCFINKMDRPGANFGRTVDMLRDRLGAKPLVIQIPFGAFGGTIDLVSMIAKTWQAGPAGAEPVFGDVPEAVMEAAVEARARMIELALTEDQVALDEYQDGTLPSAQTLKRCIRSGTLAGRFVPVLCGSAFRNRGIRLLLDAVVDFLPSPTERPAVKGHAVPTGEPVERMAGDGEPFTGYVFRGMDDPAVGELTFLRVFSGRLAKGGTVLNSSNDNRAQVDRILRMHATFREDLEEASAGDIVALPGFSGAAGGDTLCDPLHPVVLEHSVLPSPVNEFAVRAKLA